MQQTAVEFSSTSSSGKDSLETPEDSKDSSKTPEDSVPEDSAGGTAPNPAGPEDEAPTGLETVGSRLHSSLRCRPCHFFTGNMDCCRSGRKCKFCHLHRGESRIRIAKWKRERLQRERDISGSPGLPVTDAQVQPEGRPNIISL